MANEATMDKLYQMRMSVMARAYREQEESIGVAEMPFDDRLAMLVDAEWDARAPTSGRGSCARRPSAIPMPTCAMSATIPTVRSIRAKVMGCRTAHGWTRPETS